MKLCKASDLNVCKYVGFSKGRLISRDVVSGRFYSPSCYGLVYVSEHFSAKYHKLLLTCQLHAHNGFVASYTEALRIQTYLLADATPSHNLGDNPATPPASQPPPAHHARNHDDDPATPPASQPPPAYHARKHDDDPATPPASQPPSAYHARNHDDDPATPPAPQPYTSTHGPNDSPTTHTRTPPTPPTSTLTPDLHDLSLDGNQALQNSQTTPTAYGDHLPSYLPTQDVQITEPSGYGQLDEATSSEVSTADCTTVVVLKQ